MQKKTTQQYFFFLGFIVIAALTFLIIKPYLIAIIGGFLVSYMLWPAHKKLVKYVKNEAVSAILLGLTVVLITAIPLTIVTMHILEDATKITEDLKKKITQEDFIKCEEDNTACLYIAEFIKKDKTRQQIKIGLENIKQSGLKLIGEIASSIPSFMVNMLIFLFTIYVGLKGGDKMVKKVLEFIPLSPGFKKTLHDRSVEMIDATVYGSLIVALVQGVIAAIGYFIFGVEAPLLLGFLSALAALIPMVGTALVWFPIGAYFLSQALVTSNYGLNPFSHFTGSPDPFGQGIAILLWGILIVGIIDNILRPKLVGEKTKLHPLLILVSILGGIQFFGVIGLIIGPLVMAMFVTFIEVFKEEKDELTS